MPQALDRAENVVSNGGASTDGAWGFVQMTPVGPLIRLALLHPGLPPEPTEPSDLILQVCARVLMTN